MIARGCALLLLKMVISDNVERMSLSGEEIMQAAVELSGVCELKLHLINITQQLEELVFVPKKN